jgi:hypothetical protein
MGLPVEQLDGSRLLCQCTGSSQTVTITPVVRSERTPCHASFGDNYNVMSFGAHRNEPTVSDTFVLLAICGRGNVTGLSTTLPRDIAVGPEKVVLLLIELRLNCSFVLFAQR